MSLLNEVMEAAGSFPIERGRTIHDGHYVPLIRVIEKHLNNARKDELELWAERFLKTDDQCLANPEMETYYHTRLDELKETT